MSDTSFGERLRQLRLSAGMTQADLGKYLGIGKSAISNYETGISYPDIAKLIDIATLFHISMDYLLGMEDNNKERFPRDTMREDSDAIYRTAPQIPILGDISAGLPKHLACCAIDFLTIPPLENVTDFFGLKVPDNSMEKARILESDIVLIHRQNFAESGDIVLAKLAGQEPVIRRFELIGNQTQLTAQSADQSFSGSFKCADSDQIQILGKVLYVLLSL